MHAPLSITLLASRCACAAAQRVGAQAQYSSLAATTTQALSLVHRPDAQLIGATGRCRDEDVHNWRAWTAHRHQATAAGPSAPASKSQSQPTPSATSSSSPSPSPTPASSPAASASTSSPPASAPWYSGLAQRYPDPDAIPVQLLARIRSQLFGAPVRPRERTGRRVLARPLQGRQLADWYFLPPKEVPGFHNEEHEYKQSQMLNKRYRKDGEAGEEGGAAAGAKGKKK